MKKILFLSGSPRKNRNSALLCGEFARGASEAGNIVELIYLRDKKIGYCIACYYCKDHDGVCVIRDDMAEILEKMNEADIIVMASPVYFYAIDAQMKALTDRTVAQWLKIRDKTFYYIFYYIMTAAEDSDTVMDCTLECMRGLAACLEGSSEGGIIYGKGVYEPGEIKNKPAMQEAYAMGKSIA